MDSGLWVLPPLSELTTKPAQVQNMWGVGEPSKIYLGGEWVESPKLVLKTSFHQWKFYRHAELFGNVRCDKAVQKYWHNTNNNLSTDYEHLNGWYRQAVRIYAECYSSALKIKQGLDSV